MNTASHFLTLFLFFALVSAQFAQEPKSSNGSMRKSETLRMDPALEVMCLAFSPDGKILAAGLLHDGARIWEKGPTGWELTHAFRIGSVWDLAFSADGKTLATRDLKTVKRWERPEFNSIGEYKITSFLQEAFLNEDKRLDKAKFNKATGVLGAKYKGSPDCMSLAVDVGQGGATVKLYDLHTGDIRWARPAKGSWVVPSLAFSADSTLLARGSQVDITIWQVKTGELKQTLQRVAEGEKSFRPVTSLAFAPSGEILATGHAGLVKLWDVTSGQLVATFVAGDATNHVRSLAFSPDGRTLAIGERSRSVKLLNVSQVVK